MGEGAGRKNTYDNTLQSDKDDKVHDKSLADRVLQCNQPQPRPSKHPLKPVNTTLFLWRGQNT